MTFANVELKQLAAAGIKAEIARLQSLLSQLEGSSRRPVGRPAAPSPTRRKRATLTAAQRKAVSKRMKAYWAAKRKGA